MGVTLFPSGRQGVTKRMRAFCRKTRCFSRAEVYWKSTGDLDPGKSAGKDLLRRALARPKEPHHLAKFGTVIAKNLSE